MAWRYRAWLVETLNQNLPFDQFTIEQLAGDLLPGATVNQRLATGFLRQTLSKREGVRNRKNFVSNKSSIAPRWSARFGWG